MLCGLRCCSVRRKLLTGSGKAAACPSGQLARDIVQHGQQGIMKAGVCRCIDGASVHVKDQDAVE